MNTATHTNEVRNISLLGIWVNLLLTTIKFLAGIFGHSYVLVADAVNSLFDIVADFVVLVGSKYWDRPADAEHPYGHAKIETLITLFIGLMVLFVGLGLAYGAVESLVNIARGQNIVSPTLLPFVVGVIAIAIKYALYRKILSVGTRIKSTAVIANAKNHMSDMLSSIPAVSAVGLCLVLGDQYAFLDPVGAVVVSVAILFAAWEIISPTFTILLDAGAAKEQIEKMGAIISSFPEVCNFEKLRTRHLGPAALTVDVHVRVHGEMSVLVSHELTRQIRAKLQEENANIVEVTIHIEPA